ncbi:hypothetical protein [Caulobacter sp.]|uniref:hypothetical protein n=1 Tax=Caulobacter sp. TaxID=78 RepID=UPI0031DE4ADC
MRPDLPMFRLRTPRARRLAFVLALAPGPAGLVAAVNLWTSPWLLALSLVWIGVMVWRLRGLVISQPARPAPPIPEPEP